MFTLASKHSLRAYNHQIPSLLSLSCPRASPPSHTKHWFSWTSKSRARESTKSIKNKSPSLQGAEGEYPGQWNESGESKQPVLKGIDTTDTSTPRTKGTYLEHEYFGNESPIEEFHGLIKPKLPDLDKKETLTPLAEEIKTMIHARGPITFSAFWQLCMQHPKYGYYMTRDPIGREGDFITTPEMFSGFSECLAVWCAFTWESMGRPPKIKIIEYGPGMGSVARTFLDVVRKAPLKPFKDAVSIHLIESSTRLRWKQKQKLGLGNVRKFKTRVKKPVYAVTDISPYTKRAGVTDVKSTVASSMSAAAASGSGTAHAAKTELVGLDEIPTATATRTATSTTQSTQHGRRREPQVVSMEHIQQTPMATKPADAAGQEERQYRTHEDVPPELLEPIAPRKRSPIQVADEHSSAEDLDLDAPRRNPFKADRMFGDMSQTAMGAMGSSGDMRLTENMKQQYRPFDWTLHEDAVFGHVDEDMKPYVSGRKSQEWDGRRSNIEVASDPLSAKPETETPKPENADANPKKSDALPENPTQQDITNLAQNTASEFLFGGEALQEKIIDPSVDKVVDASTIGGLGVQAYDEPLSEHGAATTIPPRKTKRDLESQTARKRGGLDNAHYDAVEQQQMAEQEQTNPFESIMEKMEDMKSGTASNVDFSDLKDYENLRHETVDEEEEIWQARTNDGVLVSWHDSLHSIDGAPALFICHEFFDALPVSHFEFRPHGWVESVVDVDEEDDTTTHFKLVRGPIATFASSVLDRQFAAKGIRPSVGQQFSICPHGNEIANHMARYIKQYGGAGFIIDYGNDDQHLPAWTVQGIKEHKSADIFSKPGQVDISAHVNFSALRAAIQSNEGVKAFGPVTQSYFLQGCGIIERFRHYLKRTFDQHDQKDSKENREERQKFVDTFARIMDIEKLGGHFKVLGFCKESLGVPIGFRTPKQQSHKMDDMGLPMYK